MQQTTEAMGDAEAEVLRLNERLRQLVDAVRSLAAAKTLEAVMASVRTAARGLTGADGATFVLREGGLCFYADEEAIAPLWKGRRFPLQHCISGWVMLNSQAAVIRDIYADPRIPAEAYRPTFVKSLAMVPLGSAEPRGAIGNYWARPHTPTAGEVQLLQTLANAAAVALDNIQAYQELEQRVARRTEELAAANQRLIDEIENRRWERKRWRENSEILDRIFDTMQIGVVYLDRNFNFIRVNRAYADACGHPPEYFSGKNHFALYPGGDIEAIFRRVMETGVPFTMAANPFQFPDHPEWGVTYWDWTVHPLKDDRDEVENILFVLLDVTKRERAAKALRRSEARLTNLIDIAVDAIVAVGEDECIQIFNKGAETIFGYRAEEVLGHPLDLLLPSWSVQAHRRHLRNFAAGPDSARLMGTRHAVSGRRKDGSEFPAEGSISKQFTDGHVFFTVILRDITERRRMETELSARVRQQGAVAKLGRRALANVSWLALFDEAVATVAATLELEFCKVLQLLPDNSALRLVAGVGWREGLVGQTLVGIESASEAGYTLESGAPIVVEDLSAETRFNSPRLHCDHGVVSGISVLIGRQEMPWGILGAHSSKKRVFAKDDVNFVQSVAHLLGAAIARVEAEEYSLDLARRLLRAEDSERRRIAKELHDSTAQDLVAAMLSLACLRESAQARDPTEGKQIEDSLALLENCAHEIRTLSYVLHPPRLDETGLAGAIRHYVAGFGERTGIVTSVEIPADFDRLEETVELILFRVVQESLGNIHRHSHSTTASVRLQQEASGIGLEIRDEGRGIAPQVLAAKAGHLPGLGVGIPGMRERLRQIGGSLKIDSGGHGTTIRAVVPLPGDQS